MYNYRSFTYELVISLLLTLLTVTYGQVGLNVQQPLTESQKSDTLSVSFPNPVLPLRNWQILSDQYMQIEKEPDGLDVYNYISPDYIPVNPFKIDLRHTSNYVPREVRDELNLMKNRPRDSAFLPILPVAFLALQLASQYLLINKKTEITAENIQNCKPALPVLELLWQESPQTLTQIYKNQELSDRFTMKELQSLIIILIDNKLIRTRKIENAETKYFSAINRRHYNDVLSLQKAKKDASLRQERLLIKEGQSEEIK